jgi:hypothetical protein
MKANASTTYSEGSVWSLQFARTRQGETRAYLNHLKKAWHPIMEEAKKRRLILSYRVLLSNLTSPADWDVMLLIELENMAALDGYREKLEELARDLAAGGGGCNKFLDPGSEFMRLTREVKLT